MSTITKKRPREDDGRSAGRTTSESDQIRSARLVSAVQLPSVLAAAAAAGKPLSRKAISNLKKTGRLPSELGGLAEGARAGAPGGADAGVADGASGGGARGAEAPSAAFAAAVAAMFDGVATLSDMLNAHHSRFDAALKARWPLMTRAQRALVVDADRAALARRAAARDAAAPDFPFAAVADDHCETAYEALADASLVLAALARAMGRAPASLRLYDPFYCAGASAEHLRALGFPLVHNVKEDFYATVRASREPEFDVLVTNPAFSGDHMRHLLTYAAAVGKPYMLLMPNYVGK